MEQVQKASSSTTKKVIINRISDIPGGISLVLSTLVAGAIVVEGTPVSAPASGKRTICKQAKILAESTTTAIKVTSGTHNFKVGDFAGVKTLGKAYAITGITTTSGVDTIAVGTAIDTPTTGDFLYEMAAEAATNTSALKNEADAILKEAFVVPSTSQVIYFADAYLRADVLANEIGSEYLATLNVVEVKY